MKHPVLLLCSALIAGLTYPVKDNSVIQLNISQTLNARPVTVLYKNKLKSWTKGIDGKGLADGYLTRAAALFNGEQSPHALPDDGVFAANAFHPEIKLHYSNSDTLHNQACSVTGEGEIKFTVPAKRYNAVYLALTSAEGPSALHIKLFYTDTTIERDFILPDYYQDIPGDDPNLCYLAHDLAKWGNKNNRTENDHHNIDLLNIHPDAAKKLKAVSINKSKPGYLVFWGAAGVTAISASTH
jgi:hypothetical protein